MNTFKSIKLKANPNIWSLFFSLILILPVMVLLIGGLYESGTWYWEYGHFYLDSTILILIFSWPLTQSWIYQRWKWGNIFSSKIEIPISEVEEYAHEGESLNIRTKEGKSLSIYIKNLISEKEKVFEYLKFTKKVDFSKIENKATHFNKHYFWIFFLMTFALSFTEKTKYNPKYYLPLLRPKVINLEGTIAHEFKYRGRITADRLKLNEYPNIIFEYGKEKYLVSAALSMIILPFY